MMRELREIITAVIFLSGLVAQLAGIYLWGAVVMGVALVISWMMGRS